ncbi:MAG: hypothetical protein AAB131_09130 [Actinomycetota bacterium]
MSNTTDRLATTVLAACEEWGYALPGAAWHRELRLRLPDGLRSLFDRGFEVGLLRMTDGFRFTMRDLPSGKGPYALFSKSTAKNLPAVNWEYVVQAVDYVRAHESLAQKGFRIGVEDNLMDVTVRSATGDLLWYIESKEKAGDLAKLVNEVRGWGRAGVDDTIDDRHKDGLRKAKYLVRHRPPYFSGSAIGIRLDFRMTYVGVRHFEMHEDAIPFI